MNYTLFKSLAFRLDPEVSHRLALASLKALHNFGVGQFFYKKVRNITGLECKYMGLKFKNPIGLAAGLDKNGDYIDALASLGFGFIEVGTTTPLPQNGNPKPRLFRIPAAEALINRMGFNNKGIDYLLERVKLSKYRGILGINIGKNASTPLEDATNDYLLCFKKAYAHADYIVINISSPNTLGLRNLQHGEFLEQLLKTLKQEQNKLIQACQKKVPLVVKIAPDLTESEIITLADTFFRLKVDGIIATNTTTARTEIAAYKQSQEVGGLSGYPLRYRSTEVLQLFSKELKGQIPLIASGGVMSPEVMLQKFAAGAQLVQLYTGLIYQGPDLIRRCLNRLPNAS
jgi:dihydroorotate dehydrogenase